MKNKYIVSNFRLRYFKIQFFLQDFKRILFYIFILSFCSPVCYHVVVIIAYREGICKFRSEEKLSNRCGANAYGNIQFFLSHLPLSCIQFDTNNFKKRMFHPQKRVKTLMISPLNDVTRPRKNHTILCVIKKS